MFLRKDYVKNFMLPISSHQIRHKLELVKMGENEGPARLLERVTVIDSVRYTSMGFVFPVTYRQSKQNMRFLFGFPWQNMKSRSSFHRWMPILLQNLEGQRSKDRLIYGRGYDNTMPELLKIHAC